MAASDTPDPDAPVELAALLVAPPELAAAELDAALDGAALLDAGVEPALLLLPPEEEPPHALTVSATAAPIATIVTARNLVERMS